MRRGTKRALSFMLATAMAIAVLSGAKGGSGVGQVEAEGNKDAFGFPTEAPAGFNASETSNPYGDGIQTFNTKSEAFIWRQDSNTLNASTFNYSTNFDGDQGEEVGRLSDSSKISTSVSASKGEYRYVSTKGYDPYGTGHDSMVAMVGCRYGDASKLVVARYNGKGGGSISKDFSLRYDRKNDEDWLNSVPQWAYTNYFTLTTGDFNGDSKDEIAVYVPQAKTPYIEILNGETLSSIRTISLSDFMGDDGPALSYDYDYDERTARATVQISMDTADVNRDGSDDLLIVGSYADLYHDNKTTKRSSVFACYTDAKDKNTVVTLDRATTGECFFRTASVAAGDINFDGFPEVVVAGLYSKPKEEDDSKVTGGDLDNFDDKNYAIVTLSYNMDNKKMGIGTTGTVEMNKFTQTGLWKRSGAIGDFIHKAPAITCVAVDGMNSAEQLFLAGSFYKYNGPGSWENTKTVSTCENGVKWIGGWMITNAWVDQCVAANFNEDDLGIEEVLFTTGYKQHSTQNYFYKYDLVGKKMKTEKSKDSSGKDVELSTAGDWFEADNANKFAVDYKGKSGMPAVSVAAVDVDSDTDTFQYASKEFVYSKVSIAAILQAAPYFEDVKNLYGDLGSTSFGESVAEGKSESNTKTASVGAYVSFAIGADALKFSTEASFTHGWEWEYEKEKTREISFDLSASEEHSVVIYTIPAVLYHYNVYSADGKKKNDMAIAIQKDPLYTVMSVDRYNSIAEKNEALKDKLITESVLSNVRAGVPTSYINDDSNIAKFVGAKDYVLISNENSTTATYGLSVTDSETETNTESYTNEFELKLGISGEVDAGVSIDYSAGASAGGGWGGGKSTINYKGLTKAGEVAFPPETTSTYSFNTKIGTWPVKVGNSEVPMIGYIVRDVVMPPSPPRNLFVETVTDHSITIGWEKGSKEADYFDIYQYFDDKVTNNPYSLVDVIDGKQTSYTFDNLDPATTYSLAICARTMEKEDEIVSEFTDPVTATTLSKGESPLIARITKEQNVVVGDSATFKVEASPSSGVNSGLAYSWQVKKDAKSNWTGINKATGSSYTIENATEDMDGSLYRCIVSEIHSGERRYCYSDTGILHVGKADTSTSVIALNDITKENSGKASVTKRSKVDYPVDEIKIVKIKIDDAESSYEVYNDTTEQKKIYKDVNTGKLYLLEGYNESAKTATSATEIIHKERYVIVDGAEVYFDDFAPLLDDNANIIKEVVGGKTYWKYTKTVYNGEEGNTSGKNLTYEIYELIEQAGTAEEAGTEQFYTMSIGENNAKSMTKLEIQSYGTGEYRTKDGNITVILGNPITEKHIYQVFEDTVTDGDKVSISIKVTKDSKKAQLGTSATVRLLNTNTGDLRLLSAELDENGEAVVAWIPEKEGIYSVTAEYSGSNDTKISSAETTYYALAAENSKDIYRVKAKEAIYGETVSINTKKCTKDDAGIISEKELTGNLAVNYFVTYIDDSGSSVTKSLKTNNTFIPETSGVHTIVALINDGNTVESTRTTVNIKKRPIVVTAPTKLRIPADDKEAKKLNIDDLSISYEDDENKAAIIDTDQEKYKISDLFKYSTDPVLTEDSKEGSYTVQVGYKNSDNEEERKVQSSFKNRYSVIFNTGTYSVVNDVYSVKYSCSSNGRIKGCQGDKLIGFESGENIHIGTKLSFIAYPADDYSVSRWDVKDSSGYTLVEGTDYELIGDKIVIDSLDRNISVYASFGRNSHIITYQAEANGTVEANYLKAGQKTQKIASAKNVPDGKSIIFTAVPDKGYVVKNWKISKNGDTATILKNKDGSIYARDTYEVTVDSDLFVTVEFEKEAYYNIEAEFVSEDETVVGCSFIYEGPTKDGKIQKSKTVKISADVNENVIVKEWRLYNNSKQEYEVVQGGLESYTIENVQEDIRIVVEVAGYETYNLKYMAIDDSGYEVADVITAKCQNDKLVSGKDYVAYIPASFTAKVPKGYTVVKWTVKDVAKNTETIVAQGKDALSYELPALDKITQVILYLDKTPQVYYKADNAGGTISSAKYANGAMLTKNSKEDLTFSVNTSRYNKVKEVNVLYGKDKYTSATLSIDTNVLKDNAGTLTVKAPKDGWKKDVSVSISFEVEKPDLLAHDAETVYAGQPIDVASSNLGMFGADENLGKLVYKLENGGNGVGTLSGSSLTVTKAGTFVISLGIVDAAGKEVKAPVKATLTVKKGVGTGLVTATDITVGQNVIVNAESSTNGISNVSYTYKKFGTDTILAKAPSKVGKYTVVATFAANDLYESCVATTDFEIKDKEVDPAKEKKKNSASLNAGAKFTVKKSSAVLKWGKVKGADGYEIYGGECAPKKKLLVTVKSGKTTSYTFKKIAGKKVNGRKMYRMVVKAYKKVNGKKVYIAESLDLHSVGPENPKFTDVKSISVKKTSYNLKVGKTAKISPSRTKTESKKAYLEKWHASTYRYFSTNEDIAKVSKKGVITAKSKGTCYIYVMGVNGAQKKIKVTVK